MIQNKAESIIVSVSTVDIFWILLDIIFWERLLDTKQHFVDDDIKRHDVVLVYITKLLSWFQVVWTR